MDESAVPGLEAPIISGVAHDRSQGKITVVEVPDIPGRAALLFDVVASAGANIDMIVQNTSTTDDTVAISLTLPEADAPAAIAAIEAAREAIGYTEVRYDEQIGKVSVVGAGMKSSPGVSATLFRSLGEAGINIAGAQVSRTTEGGEALMAVTVDSPVTPELLESIAGRIGAREARAADLDTL